MRTKRRAWITALAGMVSQMFVARAPAGAAAGAKVVFQHDLPDLTLDNWAVTAVEVSYPPGGASASHRHPGFTVVYVLEGEVRSKVGDQPEATYAGGQMFFEAP